MKNMMENELLCLRFNDFENNIRNAWKEFQADKDSCDVILACDDDQVETHKFIIKSFSPVFSNILKKSSAQLSIIFLRGVKYKELLNLLTFMYQGEVNIQSEEIEDFLAVAKDLKIKGLSEENGTNNQHNSSFPKSSYTSSKSISTYEETDEIMTDYDDNFPINKVSKIEKLNEEIDPVIESSQSEINTQISNILDSHTHACDQCDYSAGNRGHLRVHVEGKHKGVKYECSQCGSTFTQQSSLNMHIKRHIENEKLDEEIPSVIESSQSAIVLQKTTNLSLHPCDQCSYIAGTKSHLRVHIEGKHKGIIYECPQCGSTFTQKSSLNKHMKRHYK